MTPAHLLALSHALFTAKIVGVLIGAQLGVVAIHVLVAKVVARESATLGRAAGWYGLELCWCATSLTAGAGMALVFKALALPALLAPLVGIAWLAVVVAGACYVPMRLFRVGAAGAVAMMVLVALSAFGVNFAAQRLVGRPGGDRAISAWAQDLARRPARVTKRRGPLPAEVTVLVPVSVPIWLDGQVKGSVQLEPGTRVHLVAVQGDRATIRYLDGTPSIPVADTDL